MEALKESAFISALLPLVIIIFIIGAGVVLLYQHFQKNLFIQKLEQETLKNIHQNDLLRSSIHAQEEERKRIAQDLHDELGAVLSIMRMNMVMLEQQNKDTPGTLLAGLQNVRSLAENAIASTRGISHRLMPPQLETFGLVKTLEAVIEQVNATGKIEIELSAPPSLPGISWPVSLGLYRVLMELVNNTIKHAEASEIKIELLLNGACIGCRYSDNGKGIADANTGKGLGLRSIEGRINSMNGQLDIGTAPTGGLYANMNIPLA